MRDCVFVGALIAWVGLGILGCGGSTRDEVKNRGSGGDVGGVGGNAATGGASKIQDASAAGGASAPDGAAATGGSGSGGAPATACTSNLDCGADAAVPCTPTTTCEGHCGTVNDGCGNQLACPACTVHCTNLVKDFDETGVDCGGADCSSCVKCLSQSDCAGHCGAMSDQCGTALDCGLCAAAGVWDFCRDDLAAGCTDNLVCTQRANSAITRETGHYGFCAKPCSTTADCDSAPAGGTATPICVAGVACMLDCRQGTYPLGFDCIYASFANAYYCVPMKISP